MSVEAAEVAEEYVKRISVRRPRSSLGNYSSGPDDATPRAARVRPRARVSSASAEARGEVYGASVPNVQPSAHAARRARLRVAALGRHVRAAGARPARAAAGHGRARTLAARLA